MAVNEQTFRHFLGGANNVAESDLFGVLDMWDPSKYSVYFEDFTDFDFGDYPADSDAVALQYAVTLDSELDYDVSFGGSTGDLVLTTEGGDTEGGQWRLNSAPFKLTAGKKAWFEVKYTVTSSAGTVGATTWFFGLSSNQTGTNFIADAGTSWAVNEAWGFGSMAAEAGVDVMVFDGDEQSMVTDVHTQVTAVEVTLGLYYDGTRTHYYKNGTRLGEIAATHPTADAMTLMIHFKSQEAQVKVLNLDHLLVILEK